MERTMIGTIKEKVGQTILVRGWVRTIRNQKSVKFIILRDISGVIQTLSLKENIETNTIVESLSLESVVEIEGEIVANQQAPGGFEIVIKTLKVISL